ncbi:MAG: HD domain-containing protein [Bacteroidales bacterium]|nr:HD domain-containing protein [Bacteroidales bacterium]
MLKQLLIIVLFFWHYILFAQFEEWGFPLVQIFSPKTYGYESQNFSIAQNKDGFLFFSNVSGILKYDGKHWNLIPISGLPKFAVNDAGVIYVGTYKDFGFIESDPFASFKFRSLVPSESLKNKIGDVYSIIAYRNEILFVGNYANLFSYNGRNIRIIDSTSNLIELFKVGNKLFVFKEPGGLYQYANGDMILWLSSKSLNNKIIEFLLPFNNQFLMKFRNEKTFFILTRSGELYPFKNQVEEYINEHQYSCHAITSDSIYIFGTYRGGIIGMNTQGEAIFQLSTENLLPNDNVNSLYIDKWNNVWVAMNNGLARIEISSAFSYFTPVNNVKGGVSSIIRHRGKIYIATTQGLFYLENKYFLKQDIHGNKFMSVDEIKVDCNKLLSTPYGLLISTDNGLYFIDNKENISIINNQYVFEDFLPLDSSFSKILISNNKGIGIILFINQKPTYLSINSPVSDHIRTIAIDKDSCIWLGSDYMGVFRIRYNRNNDSIQLLGHYRSNNGLPTNPGWIDVYTTSRGVIISTQKGPYLFNHQTLQFYKDTALLYQNKWIYPLKEDSYKNIWFSSGKEGVYEKETGVAFYISDNKYKIVKNPFRVIKDFTIESIYPDINAVTWFGTFDGLIRFDAKKQTQDTSQLNIFFTKIIAGKDTIPFQLFDNKIIEIEYKDHNIIFEFIAPYFDATNNVQYQYILEGFDKNWSEWTFATFKEYTNLFEGKYKFRVRAKNLYGIYSKEISCTIKILPPIYRTWFAYIFYIILLAAFIITIYYWRLESFAKEKHKLETLLNERTRELAEQKERAEELIKNILPEETALELRDKGTASKKKYKLVTVLFTDVQGFTHIAENMSPDMLIDELNVVFRKFDEICDFYGLEKIKTIGDAYMCAGGLPKPNRTNPIDVTLAAFKMQEFIRTHKDQFKYQWAIRIGIHSGPVVAGVVGSKKFTYDIWGDTVNIASRMESSGVANEINISGDTYNRIKDYFVCEYRGKLPVKYKGEIDMYFVKSIKPELANPNNPLEPNEAFRLKLQFLIYEDLEEFVLNKLEQALPKTLYYHNVKHTIDVIVQVEMIGLGEKVSREEMLLLKTAALMHDYGFISGYDDHEELSVKHAREILPKYKYSPSQIDTVCRLILATKFPPDPKDKLEMIICDADLDYLGRSDFIPVSQNLFRELYERGKIRSVDEWNKLQYEFIKAHQYYTETAKQMRSINKSTQLEELNKINYA